jgi:uncharacterized repeat protein (TIGR01451 family)
VALAATAVGLMAASPAVTAPGDTANLRITKSDSPDPVTVGQTLTYTINVSDLGPQAATGTTVTDRLPQNADFVSAQSTNGTCKRTGRTVTCQVGNLAGSGSEATITIRVKPRRVGTITNTAEVESVENDPVAANNTATATTTVRAAAEPPAAPKCAGVTATIRGTAGHDVLKGTAGRDVILAFAGNDRIYAYGGRDLICANRGADVIGAGARADRVIAGPGNDRVRGRRGNDRIFGNAGRDILGGNRGNDVLRGGRGFDRCFGGFGADTVRSCEN